MCYFNYEVAILSYFYSFYIEVNATKYKKEYCFKTKGKRTVNISLLRDKEFLAAWVWHHYKVIRP